MIPLGFLKMIISSDLNDKVVQILVGLVAIVIVCFAWRTTNIREQPLYRTVVLLDRRIRRRSNQRLTTHIQTTSIVGGDRTEEISAGSASGEPTVTVESSESSKPPEASTSTNTGEASSSSNLQNTSTNIEDEELAAIVHIMDADTNMIRLRRLAYYQNQHDGSNRNTERTPEQQSSAEATPTPHPSNPVEEAVEMVNEPIMEHNYAERDAVIINSENTEEESGSTATTDSNIRIKLKYLNDELKLVDGRLEEQLGDFKRRHFHPEFSANKLVRLIFNGQVLQPDTETLQSCGLFDNCVVHCLIHQQRNIYNENSSGSGFGNSNMRTGSRLPQGNNQGRDWDLGNFLLFLITVLVIGAWYIRFEYAHLYTVTTTGALVAITGIFSLYLFALYFPDSAQPSIDRQSVAS